MSQRLPGFDFAADLDESLAVLRDNVPADGQPYYGLFSGGKDSVVIKHLAAVAEVPVEWHYNVTTIDPPELVKFIKREHPDVIWERPRHGNFFNYAAEKRGFPTRRARWCCDEYKESRTIPKGSVLLMGIRSQESPRRAKFGGHVTTHRRTGYTCVSPIFHWDAEDLWVFIRSEGIPYSELYNEGFTRLGCIGCPMGRRAGRLAEFARWPKYEQKWRRVFQRTWERKSGSLQRDGRIWFGDVYFRDWHEMWEWWLSDKPLPQPLDQERARIETELQLRLGLEFEVRVKRL